MALRHYPKEIEELMEIWEPYEDKVKDMIYHRQLNLFTNHQNINQKDRNTDHTFKNSHRNTG